MVIGGQVSTPGRISNQSCGAAGSGSTNGVQPDTPAMHKLRKAAQEFESMLIASWWRSMKDSALGDSEDDGPSGTMTDMGVQAMSQAVASAGGLGLAKMVVHYLQPKVEAESCAIAGQQGIRPGNSSQSTVK